MKNFSFFPKLLLFGFFLAFGLNSHAQIVNYSIGTLVVNGGNPGNLNADLDNLPHTTANGFTELLGGGAFLPLYSASQTLPFPFSFNGVAQTKFVVSHTGIFSFDTTQAGRVASPANGTLTSANIPNNSIAGFWCNWTSAAPSGADDKVYSKVYGTAPNRQLWIDWFSMELGSASDAHFSIVLEEGTNKIYVVDKNLWSGTNVAATVGVKVSSIKTFEVAGSPSLTFGTGTSAISDNDYYTFTPTTISSYLKTIGAGTSNNTRTTQPTPYAASNWGNRLQMLIRKSELAGLDTTPILNSLAFNVVTLAGNPLAGFSIKLKNVTDTVLTGYISGATQVYSTVTYIDVAGWNNHIFDSPFQWDTTKNLLVEVCFSNSNAVTNGNAIVNSTNVGFNSTIFNAANTTGLCNSRNVVGTSQLRPNMQINGLFPFTDLLAPNVVVTSSTTNGCNAVPRNVTAAITDNDTVVSATIKYSFDNGATYTNVSMTKGAANVWSGTIPAAAAGQGVIFFIQAADRNNNINTPDTLRYKDQYLYVDLGADQAITAGSSVTIGPNGGIAPGAELKITEVVMNGGTGRGAQLTPPAAHIPWANTVDLVEIMNTGRVTVDLQGYQLRFLAGFNPFNYTFPAMSLAPGEIAIVATGTGADSLPLKFVRTNNNFNLSNGGQWGLALFTRNSRLMDAMASGNYQFPITSGVTSNDWAGNLTTPPGGGGSGWCAWIRNYSDKNDNTDWAVSDTNGVINRTSIGVRNPKLVLATDTNRYEWRVVGNSTIIDTNSVTTVSPTTNTFYALTVRDAVCSYTDTILVSIITYCDGASRDSSAFIAGVATGSLRTTSNYSTNGYQLYTTPVTNLVRGSSNNAIWVNPGFATSKRNVYVKSYMDFNKDGDFADAGEEIFSAGPDTAAVSGTYSVPTNAVTGITRFRVVLQADSFANLCDTVQTGEIEDYLVNVVNAQFDQDAPVVVSVDAIASACVSSARNVGAIITDNFGVDSAFLSYSTNNGTSFTTVSMINNLALGKWEASIPSVALGTTVIYYVSAVDFNRQRSANSPSKKYKDGAAMVYGGTDTVVAPNGNVRRIAKTDLTNVAITEVLFNRGQAGTQATFPAFLPQNGTADQFEVTNYGGFNNDLSGFTAQLYYTAFGGGPGGGTLTTLSKVLPAGTVLGPNQQMIFVLGTGADNAANRVFFIPSATGGFVDMNSFGPAGFALLDTAGNPVDAIGFNNIAFPNTRITSADWRGNIAIPAGGGGPGGNSYAGVQRTGTTDRNDSSDWVISNAANLSTIANGTPNLTLAGATMNWTVAGNATPISNNDTLQVSVGSTTSYVVALNANGCTVTDTVLVEVDSSITNLTAIEVNAINPNCNLTSNEPVAFKFKNNGADSINFSLRNATVTLDVFNGTTTVSVTDTLRSGVLRTGDTLSHTFNGVNLTVGNTYQFTAWVKINNDRVVADDTTRSSLKSEALFVNAGLDRTVVLGQSTSLNATSNFKKIVISEVVQTLVSPGVQTTFPAAFGNVTGQLVDMFELANVTGISQSIAGYSLSFYGLTQTADYTYTFPAGAVVNGNGVVSFLTNNGTNNLAAGVFFRNPTAGGTNTANNGDAFGIVLRDNSGAIVDVMATNGYNFTVASGVTAADWGGGNTGNAGFAGTQRIGFDSNKVTDWVVSNPGRPSTMGTLQTGLTSPIGTFAWSVSGGGLLSSTNPFSVSPTAPTSYVATLNNGICTVTDTVNIAIDSNAVDFVALQVGNNKSACQYSNSDTVYFRVKNQSAVAINFATRNLNARLVANGTPYTTSITTGTSNPNDTLLLTFTGVNLGSTVGNSTIYNLVASISVNGDANRNNDTTRGIIVSEKLGVNAGPDIVVAPGANFNLQSKAFNRVRFTEFIWITSAGTNGLQAAAPAGVTNWGNAQYDYFEIGNPGANNVDMSNWTFQSFVNNGRPGQVNYSYTIPNGTILNSGNAIILSTDTGANGNGVLFMGRNTVDNYNSGGQFGLVLKDAAGNVVDAFATGGYTFNPLTSGVRANQWVGNIVGGVGSAGVKRNIEDNDSSNNWVVCNSALNTTNLGTLQPMRKTYLSWLNNAGVVINNTDTTTQSATASTYFIAAYSNGTCTAYDTVNVNVNNNVVDAQALFPELVNAPCTLGSNETVRAVLRNVGATALNFATTPVTVTLTAGPAIYTGVLNSGTANPLDTFRVTITGVNLAGVGAPPATAKVLFTFTMTGDANAANNRSDSIFVGNQNNTVTASALRYTINFGDSTKVYANAPGAVKITEVVAFATGLGSQDSITIPTGYPWAFTRDMFEITNLGMGNVNLQGDSLVIYRVGGGPGGLAPIVYALPNVLLEPGSSITVVSDTGTNNPGIGLYYIQTGGANPLTSGAQAGVVIRGGSIKDAVALNGYNFPAATGVTASDWSGAIPSSNARAGVFRLPGNDNNRATDWVVTDTVIPNRRTSIGALNPGVVAPIPVFLWFNNGNYVGMGDSLQVKPGDTSVYTVSLNYGSCSAIDTVKVNVIPTRNFNDMQAVSFATSNTTPIRGPISIQANFKNLGKPAKNFIVALSANGTLVAVDTVNLAVSIWPDSVYTHTFRAPWIPGIQVNNTLCAIVSISADQNIANDTTCESFLSGVGTKNLVKQSVQMYPNPSKNVVTLNAGEDLIQSIRILDLQGRMVLPVQLGRPENQISIEIQTLHVGTYLVEIQTKQGTAVGRLVKE